MEVWDEKRINLPRPWGIFHHMRDMESLFSGETKRLIIKAYLQAAVKKRGA
jgi:hypothetical protein